MKSVASITAPMAEEKLLEYAALAECSSSHPISKSLQRAYGKAIDRTRVTDIQEISGNGVTANGRRNPLWQPETPSLMKQLGISHIDCHQRGHDHPHGR